MLNPKAPTGRRTIRVSATRPKRGEESRDPLKNYIGKLPLNVRAMIAKKLSHETRSSLAQASKNTHNIEGEVNRQTRTNILKKIDKITNAILEVVSIFNENLKDFERPSQSISLLTPFITDKNNPNLIGLYKIEIANNFSTNATNIRIEYHSMNITQENPNTNIDDLLKISIPSESWGIELKNTIKNELIKMPVRFFENLYITGFFVHYGNLYGLSYHSYTFPITNKVILSGSFYKKRQTIDIKKPFNEYMETVNQLLLEEKASPGVSTLSLENTKKIFKEIVKIYKTLNETTGGRKRKPSAK